MPDYEVWNLQYATLTDKAAKDFAPIPGLATSWKGSEDGKTWTYTMRPNLKWSDGKPLTSADVVYTINRARKEEWLNYTSTIGNITASAPDARTVVLRSSVPDPKLPVMDVYILPKHIWEKQSASAITKYRALDGVGSGPFTLTRYEHGQFWRMKANPNYWKGRPKLDEIIFRFFNNPDAMVAALQRGEADVIFDLPSGAFLRFQKDPDYVAVQGYQGSFDELAANWKICVGNYLECYHCAGRAPGLQRRHRRTAGRVQAGVPSDVREPLRARARRRRRGPVPSGVAESEAQRHAGAGEPLDRPAAAGRPGADGRLPRLLLRARRRPEWLREFQELDDAVGAEDRVLVESVQRGMRSGALESGRLLLGSEHLVAEFQRYVLDALGDGP